MVANLSQCSFGKNNQNENIEESNQKQIDSNVKSNYDELQFILGDASVSCSMQRPLTFQPRQKSQNSQILTFLDQIMESYDEKNHSVTRAASTILQKSPFDNDNLEKDCTSKTLDSY